MKVLVREFIKSGSVQHLNAGILMLHETMPETNVISYMLVVPNTGVGTFRIGLEKDGKEIDTSDFTTTVLRKLAPASAAALANAKRAPVVFVGLPFEAAKELENKVFALDLYKKNPEAYWTTMPGYIRRTRCIFKLASLKDTASASGTVA